MTAPDLKRRLDEGESLVLLDVREDDERACCAIPSPASATDLHIPMGQVQDRLAAIVEASAAGPLVVYCHLGQRSAMVARWLAAQGIATVHNLDGGIDAWTDRVDPGLPRY